MKIYKRKSLLQGTNFIGLAMFSLCAVVFAVLFLYGVSRDGTPFSIMGLVCLLFVLLGVVGAIALYQLMNYVVIDGDRIIFANAVNPYRRDEYNISEISRVVFDSQVTDVVTRYGGRQRIGMRYMSFYIAQQKQRYSLNMINDTDYSLIIGALESRGIEVECSAQFNYTK